MKSSEPNIHDANPPPSRFYYTLEELRRIRGAARGPADQLRIRLEAQAGLLSEEAAMFSQEMIDLVNDLVWVGSREVASLRTIPLQASLRRHIELMMSDGPLSYSMRLICSDWPHRLTQIVHSAGIEPIPYGLRHGYAMHREAQGVPPQQLAMELGVSLGFLRLPQLVARPRVSAVAAASWFSE